jgi:hypothetical protein
MCRRWDTQMSARHEVTTSVQVSGLSAVPGTVCSQVCSHTCCATQAKHGCGRGTRASCTVRRPPPSAPLPATSFWRLGEGRSHTDPSRCGAAVAALGGCSACPFCCARPNPRGRACTGAWRAFWHTLPRRGTPGRWSVGGRRFVAEKGVGPRSLRNAITPIRSASPSGDQRSFRRVGRPLVEGPTGERRPSRASCPSSGSGIARR